MKKGFIFLTIFAALALFAMILFLLVAGDRGRTIKDLSLIRVNEITILHIYLSEYDFINGKEIPYRFINAEKDDYSSILQFIKELQGLKKSRRSIENKSDYKKIVTISIEQNNKVTLLEISVNPENYNLYLPAEDLFCISTPSIKMFLKSILE